VIDDLIRLLEQEGVYCQFFADDGVVVVRGKDLGTLCGLMNQAVGVMEGWCGERGLAINPEKAKLLLFTRKRSLIGWRSIIMGSREVERVTEFKYLGVTVTPKLSWKVHITNACKKAVRMFHQCRRAIGRTWGLNPVRTLWLYQAVVKPARLLYGALAWWGAAN